MTTPQFFGLVTVILIAPHLDNATALVLASITLAVAAFVLWRQV